MSVSVKKEKNWMLVSVRVLLVLIAVGAGVLSFDGLRMLAVASGIRVELSWVWALVIDGFIVVATFATFMLKDREGERGKQFYAWFVFGVFVLVSILGNAWHGVLVEGVVELPYWVKVFVNAIPPVAFFLAGHLIIVMLSPTVEQKKAKAREKARRERLLKAEDRREQAMLKKVEKGELVVSSVDDNGGGVAVERVVAETPPVPSVKGGVGSSSEGQVSEGVGEQSVPVSEGDVISREEAYQRLVGMGERGEALPTGRVVGGWMGFKEKSGQGLLRKVRADLGL